MSFLRRLLRLFFSPLETTIPSSDSSARGRIAGAYREWAAAQGMRVRDDPGLRFFGRLRGRDVVVDPGIDGTHPGWVQVTVGVALSSVTPMLVTRATRTSDFAIARIRALFDDRDVGLDLRAISVSPHHVRLRLAPGASPCVVEQAVQAVGDAMRIIHAEPESEPRHSCTMTIPHPS